MLLCYLPSCIKLCRFRGFQKGKILPVAQGTSDLQHVKFTPSRDATKSGNFEEFLDKWVKPPTLTCCNLEVL